MNLARAEISKYGLITPLVLLLEHESDVIRESVRGCLTQLRGGEGEMIVPFLETGNINIYKVCSLNVV